MVTKDKQNTKKLSTLKYCKLDDEILTSVSLSFVLSRDPIKVLKCFYDTDLFFEDSIYFLNYLGYTIPILPFPINLYNHINYLKAKDTHKYHSICSLNGIRDGIIHSLISFIKDENKSKKSKKVKLNTRDKDVVINNSIPIVFHWLADIGLPLWDLITGGGGYRIDINGQPVVRDQEVFRVCKECFDLYHNKVPHNRLCHKEINNCKRDCGESYIYNFVNPLIKDVEIVSNELSKVLLFSSKGLLEERLTNISGTWERIKHEDVIVALTKCKNKINDIASRFKNRLVGRDTNRRKLISSNFDPYLEQDLLEIVFTETDSDWYLDLINGIPRTEVVKRRKLTGYLRNYVLYSPYPIFRKEKSLV